jgi:uncharacterized protein DUF6398
MHAQTHSCCLWAPANNCPIATCSSHKETEMPEDKRESIPQPIRPTYDAIVRQIDTVCQGHLNQEYADLGRRLAGALARKRPSPLLRGKPEVWACGIVYAIGTVNFLFDKTQTPYLRADELCRLFKVSPSAGSAKAALIRKMFGMMPLDPRWSLTSMIDQNPLAWMIEVNGLIVDARSAPREIQEEALRRGLIPYLPPATPADEES